MTYSDESRTPRLIQSAVRVTDTCWLSRSASGTSCRWYSRALPMCLSWRGDAGLGRTGTPKRTTVGTRSSTIFCTSALTGTRSSLRCVYRERTSRRPCLSTRTQILQHEIAGIASISIECAYPSSNSDAGCLSNKCINETRATKRSSCG